MSLASLFPETYVLLTTFRKTGVGVPTVVWAAQDGDALLVTTLGSAGKVKRIRNNPEVTLQPCTMSGKVKRDAEPIAARAEIVDDPAGLLAGTDILRAKYGWMFRWAFRAEERRTKGRGGASGRIILRITAA
jgi:PPOX class probable F420-dependent enzyme